MRKSLPILILLLALPLAATAQTRQELISDILYLRKKIDSLTVALNEYKMKENQQAPAGRSSLDFWDDSDAFLTIGDGSEDGLVSTWDLLVDESVTLAEEEKDVREYTAGDERMLMERLASLPVELSIGYNDIVKNYVLLYAEKKKSYMPYILSKFEFYNPIFKEAFEKEGVPEELTALCIIESAMNPTATSYVGAKGYWQFMPGTAKAYGMAINYQVDERMDLLKAVSAAARLLKKMYDRYGDWPLAISSYNCGPGNVDKAIRLAGKKDYWAVYKYLPQETRGYMPALIGAMYVVKYGRTHGMDVKPLQNEDCEFFTLSAPVDFATVSSVCGCPVSELRRLNPQFIRNVVVVPKNGTATLRIPKKYASRFRK